MNGVAPGDEVFGFSVGGAAAEEAVLDDFARKPAGLSWEEAAALPVAVETSLRVFGVLGGVGEGQTLVVNGAAGGVGVAAVQIARARGARVIGTASEANHEFLRSLGVEPTTYGDGMVAADPRARARRRRPGVRHGRQGRHPRPRRRSPATRRGSRRSPTSAPPRSA